MISLQEALRFAGVVHLGILAAGLLVPRKLDWKGQFQGLSPLNRRLFWTYGIYVFATIASIGITSLVFAGELSNGSVFSRYLCGLFFLFWFGRLVIAVFFFDVREHLTSAFYRWGYLVLNASFVVLCAVYGWAIIE